MGTSTDPVVFPSYSQEHTVKYAHTVVGHRRIGTTGASLVRFECAAGNYPHVATSDFALMGFQRGVAAELDLGAGRFSAYVAAGELLFSPPFTATESAFHGAAKGLLLAVPQPRVSELLGGVDLTPGAGFRELYTHALRDEFISVALAQLWTVAPSRRRGEGLFADAAILAIFAALPKHGRQSSHERSRHGGLATWQLRRVIEKLDAMWADDLSLGELASTVNLSPFHFARGFKQSTGVSPHRYQLKLRLDRARDLLTRTALPVTEIALCVGYGSSQAFARVFHQELGVTPSEYRRSASV
jgi:AraC family transcriptional regulator